MYVVCIEMQLLLQCEPIFFGGGGNPGYVEWWQGAYRACYILDTDSISPATLSNPK